MVNERAIIGWLGEWEIEIRENGKVKDIVPLTHNLIMDAGINMLRDALSGAITTAEIKYIALGNSSTAPAITQTTLVAEQFRKLITSQANLSGVGILETIGYIDETEANTFLTEEIGWFAGAGATAAANTGIMVARVLYTRQKNALETWTVRRVDTILRA